jgi:hypothetical protein
MSEQEKLLESFLSKKKSSQQPCDKIFCLKMTIDCFLVIVVLAVAGVAIAALIVNANYLIVQRNCVSSLVNDTFTGLISTNTNGPSFDWDLQYLIGVPTINTIHIYGPIPAGQSTSSTLLIALCGTPSTLACDVSIPSVLKGSVKEYNGAGVKTLIQSFRERPNAYYVLINGIYRLNLGNLC